MGLSLRLSLAIVTILAMALALTALLSYFQFENTLTELQRSRIAVIALDIKQTIEDSTTNRDLPLKNYELYGDFIQRAEKGDQDIRSIVVFDRLGAVLPYPALAKVSEKWVTANAERCSSSGADNQTAGASLWKLTDAGVFVVGAAVCTAFKTVIGGIGVEYSRESQGVMLNNAMAELSEIAGAVFLGFVALTVLAVFLVFQPLIRAAKRMDASLHTLLRNGSVKPADEPPRLALERDFAGFRARTEDALAALTEAERDLHERDRVR